MPAKYTYRLERRRDLARPEAAMSPVVGLASSATSDARCAGAHRKTTGSPATSTISFPGSGRPNPEEWNLQALCSDCNEGKKAYYATFDAVAPQIMNAIGHESVYVRIGEVLKAFEAEGLGTPTR